MMWLKFPPIARRARIELAKANGDKDKPRNVRAKQCMSPGGGGGGGGLNDDPLSQSLAEAKEEENPARHSCKLGRGGHRENAR